MIVPVSEDACQLTACLLLRISQQKCAILLHLCRGIDTSQVVDDEGGLPKTVSVENSFRRGTVCSMEVLHEAMEDLYRRLPRLVENRKAWSDHPDKAFPTTLRLTVRQVDNTLRRGKRPFVTYSRQVPLKNAFFSCGNGNGTSEQWSKAVRRLSQPLLQSLVLQQSADDGIDVTRVNIAVADFQDILPPAPSFADHPNHPFSSVTARRVSEPPEKGSCATPTQARGQNKSSNGPTLDTYTGRDYVLPKSSGTPKTTPRKRRRIDEFFAPRKKSG